ncbi:MAG: SDR family oxidoreductase [Wenzhouxiangellaceae bacterium]|nr:SDR family oxidoreductase [Wenzhouxiangellaceae bacterium]
MSAPIIILGARGGTGEALARRLADAGHELFLTARDASTIEELADATGARTASLDVNDTDAIADVIGEADTGDGIAGLAYCVGDIVLKPLKSASPEDYLDCFRLNTLGAALSIKAAEKGLKQAGGSVVLFSTVAVGQGFPNHAVIATAKGGVEGLARSLAAELAPDVRVNCIAPSITDTGIAESLTSSERMKEGLANAHPRNRIGQPEDLARAAAFLLTEDADWVTGQVIGIDGGRSALRVRNQ